LRDRALDRRLAAGLVGSNPNELRGELMKRFKIRRPSAPMIFAIVALVIALGGTAVAGGGFLTKKKFNKFKSTAITAPVSYVVTDKSVPGGGTYTNVAATCPAGTKVVGGGIKIPNPSSGTTGPAAFLDDSYPTQTGWAGHVVNGNPAATTVTATTIAIGAIVPSTAGAPPAS
jgi:hypothetical protein